MYEVEVKVRADHEAVRRRLSAAGAESVGRVRQRDTYYDAPHRDFAATDEALRVRRERETPPEGGAAVDETGVDETEIDETETDETGTGETDADARITYKGPLVESDSKTRREHETGVADGETADEILGALGFEPAAVVEKERERFRLDGYAVALDAVTGVGTFVEVEREVPESAVEDAREGAFDVLRELGLDPDDQTRTSYLGLLLDERE